MPAFSEKSVLTLTATVIVDTRDVQEKVQNMDRHETADM